jgi:GntR family transcriptional regulator, transcriptional repressor for pyruvate dehydrogenase complex
MPRKNYCDEIVEDINSQVLSGVYKPGDQIPNEFGLAEKYNVSRFVIREAIKKLCTSGIIRVERGRGTFVNKMNSVSFMKPLLPLLILDNCEMVEICEARLAIEKQTVLLCSQKASDDDVDYLNSLLKKMEGCLVNNNFESYNNLDLEFHLFIAKTSGNRILFKMLETIQDLLKAELNRTSAAPNANENSITRHKLIVYAIKEKRGAEAVALMNDHIDDAIIYFKSLMENVR